MGDGLFEFLHEAAGLRRQFALQAMAEARGHLSDVGFEAGAAVVGAGGEDGVGGQDGGFDGGADALAALRVGESGGVADEE